MCSFKFRSALAALVAVMAVGISSARADSGTIRINVFKGGPTGAEALSATMNLAIDTLTDEVEPYLLRRHFIVRTPRGRRATAAAYEHLGLAEPPNRIAPEVEPLFDQRRLFE